MTKLVDWMEQLLHDPKGFFLAMLAFAMVAFVNALSRGETILRSIAHGMVTFIICGSSGAILIFYCKVHPFVACGICGLISTISHRLLPAMERLVGVAEKKAATVITNFDVLGVKDDVAEPALGETEPVKTDEETEPEDEPENPAEDEKS